MKIRSSLKVMLLALAVNALQAEVGCDDLCGRLFDTNNWYITPKIGVAPTIFAGGRANQRFVVPFAAIDPTRATCDDVDLCTDYRDDANLLVNYANTLQDGPCLPKFNDMFKQGVLHVGVELGYQSCEADCPIFVEFVYNRANGKCTTPCGTYITNQASIGCTNDCNTSCSTSSSSCSNSCSPSGTTLSAICALNDNYSNYSAYGAYIGGRHFTDRFWCDTTAWWFGYKFGILHRKQVNSCSTLVAPTDAVALCSGTTQNVSLNRAIFCKSNAVSGGIQMGFDYDYSDCLSFQLGFEVVASCGLKGNKNYSVNLNNIFLANGTTPVLEFMALPSNILVGNTGPVINFPIWFGVRWDFGGFCNPCGAC